MRTLTRKIAVLCVLLFGVFSPVWSQTVKVVQDKNGGWEMLVDNKQFFVKGVNWSVTPPGVSFIFSLWDESDATIRKVIDTEGAMMKEAGINAIKVGPDIPRKWVEYMYNKHGIYTIINYDMERWGASANGKYYFPTNYYIEGIRGNIRNKTREILDRYKDATGVLMYMYGNGNGHGFYFSEHENDPETIKKYGIDPRFRKAKAFFSLLEEVFQMTKEADPYRPVGFLTNDLGWIELLVDDCPSMDYLGVNLGGDWGTNAAGPKFWQDAREKLNKPIVMGSIGCDAWNSKLNSEDQYYQAWWLTSLWKDIYENAYGKGQSNALGAVVDEWTDQWYKNDYEVVLGPQVSRHDTAPTGRNPGYFFDFVEGQDNMTPEWRGITSQGSRRYHSWFAQKRPRASYYALQHIWSADPWTLNTAGAVGTAGANTAKNPALEAHFANLDMALCLSRGLQDSKEMIPDWKITNQVNVLAMQTGDDVQKSLKDDKNLFKAFNDNQWGVDLTTTFWGVAEQGVFPGNYLEGAVTLWLRHDAVVGEGPVTSKIYRTSEMGLAERPFEIYQAWFTWKGFGAEVNANYHYGKGSWQGEGDFFNFNAENYDLYSNDIWDIKSPISVEGRYNFKLPGRQGLAVIAGPNIHSGANPMVLGKWYHTFEIGKHAFGYSALLGQEFSAINTELGAFGTPGEYSDPNTVASIWLSWKPFQSFSWLAGPHLEVQAGLMGANFQKIGERYFKRGTEENYYPFEPDPDNVYGLIPIKEGEITAADTLSAKLRAEYRTGGILSFQTEIIHAGLVADTNWVPALNSTIFADIGTGNRFEVKGGVTGNFSNISAALNALYRRPYQGAVTSRFVGAEAIDGEPFRVMANREALIMELLLGYDLQPSTWLWEWNVWDTEAAKIASRFRGRYTIFEGQSDPGFRKGADGKRRYNYTGYPETGYPDTLGNYDIGWMVFWNPSSDLRVGNSLNFTRGFAYNGIPDGTEDGRVAISGWTEEIRVRYKRVVAKGSVSFNLWGPVSTDRENNQTYPMLWSFDLAWGLTPKPSLMDSVNRVGVRWNGVIRDRYSPNAAEARDHQELALYFNYVF